MSTIVVSAGGVLSAPLSLEVSTNALGRYSLIVLTNSGLIGGFSAQLYEYQRNYGVRLVALNDAPSYAGKISAFGGATGCQTGALIVTPASAVFTNSAGLKSNWSLAIDSASCAFPGTITDSATTTPVVNFVSNGVAAAVIDFGRNQQQMSFFLPCKSTSFACLTMGHVWFQWATRGTYTGIRRIYFTPQIDDVFLATAGNDEKGNAVEFRIRPSDVQGLLDWMPAVNKRLPVGSNLTIEMAFNGNGVMEYLSKQNPNPGYFVNFNPDQTNAPLDWKKPLGTASKSYWGLDGQPFWSNKSMVTPGISGIFNSDALRALLDFGITGAVSDSSRPKTQNTVRPFYWPMTTTVANNGYAGFTLIPRQSLNIFYSTSNQEYNTILFNSIYGTTYTFADIMALEPAMFHQANLRNADLPVVLIGGTVSGRYGLMQQWVENVFGAFGKVSNWPVVTLKQDLLTAKFINRQVYETADVNVVQLVNVTASGVAMSGFTISAAKRCVAPVTLPPSVSVGDIVSLPAGATTEQIGAVDSVTVWIPLVAGASPITVKFSSPKLVNFRMMDFTEHHPFNELLFDKCLNSVLEDSSLAVDNS
ncbi:hypothetical protein BDR26DRAFT_960508 [Obelidium mucronatum]|nr:hypothetical protein BDR26DRAFT_960508 [Obelidium mucronatum]